MTANILFSSKSRFFFRETTGNQSSHHHHLRHARAHTDRSSFLLFNQTERGVDSNSREKHPCTALLHQRRRRRRTFFGVCVEIDFLKSDSHHAEEEKKNAPIHIQEY